MKVPRNIPGVIVSNVSFPKILEEKIGGGKESSRLMLPYLFESIDQLEKAGADFLILPCNTLHSLLPELRRRSKREILDLIEEVSREIKNRDIKTVGILSTTRTRQDRLYDHALKETNLIYPSKEEQEKVSEIIVRIIRKKDKPEDKIYLEGLILGLIRRGAEKVVLACTDLANIIDENGSILDSTNILIKAIRRRIKV